MKVQQDIPKWMNEQFFGKVIRACISDKDVKIIGFTINPASKSNDLFASPIFRATITVWSKQTPQTNFTFVLKVPSAARPVKEDASFENEISIYSSILDEMHRLVNRAGENVQFGPRVIYYTAESNAVVVLEDLSSKMYAVPETTMNLNKTLATVYKLARWHATSLFMANENQNVSSFASGIFNKKYSENLTFMLDNYRYFVNVVRKWQGFEDYAVKLSALENSLFAKGKDIFTAKPNGFNVLNHGDLNFKNILTKGDEEQNDVIFVSIAGIFVDYTLKFGIVLSQLISTFVVDFQYCVWASPAIDLLSVLYLVATSDVRQRFKNELITYYYNEFTKSLKSIGHLAKPPSMLDLQIELQRNGFLGKIQRNDKLVRLWRDRRNIGMTVGFYGRECVPTYHFSEVIIAVCNLPFILVDQDRINDEITAEKLRDLAYTNPDFLAIIKNQLPYFLTKGYLN